MTTGNNTYLTRAEEKHNHNYCIDRFKTNTELCNEVLQMHVCHGAKAKRMFFRVAKAMTSF